MSFDVYLKKTLVEAVIDKIELQERDRRDKKAKEKTKEKTNHAAGES